MTFEQLLSFPGPFRHTAFRKEEALLEPAPVDVVKVSGPHITTVYLVIPAAELVIPAVHRVIPATHLVIPAQAGIQTTLDTLQWIPAFAGMTRGARCRRKRPSNRFVSHASAYRKQRRGNELYPRLIRTCFDRR